MIEFIRHALGLCGEHWHPNIFTIIASGFGLVPAIQYIKIKYLKNGNPEIKKENKSKVEKQHQIILHNDNVNTFEHVIVCLVFICGHSVEQAEQCAIMVDRLGKCGVKSGTMDEILPIAEALDGLSLHIEII